MSVQIPDFNPSGVGSFFMKGLLGPASFSLESYDDLEAMVELEELLLSIESMGTNIPTRSEMREVFETELGALVPDAKLAKAIRSFVLAFVTKNEDHIHFFGSPLLGVYPVRFTDDDRLAWFDDILDCDEIHLTSRLHRCKSVNPDHIVASDAMNESIGYLLHLFHHSTRLPAKDIEAAKVDLIRILHFKYISSIMAKYFKYNASKEVALATYAALSKKYDLKVYGSWGALIQARAEAIVSKQGLHYNTYVRYDNDKAIQYMITDIQCRIREVIKAMTAEFYAVRDRDGKISSASATMELDGTTVVKDRSNAFLTFRRYLGTILNDPNSFVRDNLVHVVSVAMSNVPEHHIKEALYYLCDNHGDPRQKYLEELCDEILLHAFEYIHSKGTGVNNLNTLAAKMKAIYTASRSSNEAVLKMRDLAWKLAEASVTSKDRQVKVGVRTAVMLYVLLRTLSMNFYK